MKIAYFTITRFLWVIISFLLSSCLSQKDISTNEMNQLFDKTNLFLKKNIREKSINYNVIKDEISDLDTLLHQYENHRLTIVTDSLFYRAYLINYYNLVTIKQVCTTLPINRISDSVHFFSKPVIRFKDQLFSLNEFRNQLILKSGNYEDFLLLLFPFKSEVRVVNYNAHLESQEYRNELAKEILSNKEYIRIKPAIRKVLIPETIYWHTSIKKEDILNEIKKYREITADFELDYYPINWSFY